MSWWRDWLKRSSYRGRWQEMVNRSALTLKLLANEKTGGIAAAGTFGLPEEVGGERNWDYRFTWIRDASFTAAALIRLGFDDEARAFVGWVQDRYSEPTEKGKLQIMYGIDGRHELTEEILDHLEGYRTSSPVRIGNAAYDQLQLDIYGELLYMVDLFDEYVEAVSYDFWTHLASRSSGRPPTGKHRRGDLGGARRPARVPLLAPDELGRHRSRHPHRRRALAARPDRTLARGPRRDPQRHLPRVLEQDRQAFGQYKGSRRSTPPPC